MKTVRVISSVVLLCLLCLLSGCEGCKTDPNTSDTTPPDIKWKVTNRQTNEVTEFNGNGTFNAEQGVEYMVSFCPTDDGGIKEIQRSSTYSASCNCGSVGSSVGPSLGVLFTTPLGLDSDGKAWKTYCDLIFDIKLNGTVCAAGCTLNHETLVINGTAKNYADLTNSGSLTITLH